MKSPAAFSTSGLVATLALTLALSIDAPASSALPKSSVVYNAGDSATAIKLSDAQLETLLGPVALYPDALIALHDVALARLACTVQWLSFLPPAAAPPALLAFARRLLALLSATAIQVLLE
jgi:hypothetical protein